LSRGFEPIKVIYLLGAARSGTTLLTGLLGEMEGFFAAAEMRLVWHGFDERRCGCGTKVKDCPVWSAALSAATMQGFRGPAEVIAMQRELTRTRHLPELLAGIRPRHNPQRRRYLGLMEQMYAAVSETSGADVIVDSSKAPGEAVLLRNSEKVTSFAVQVVRDARAVAYSWERVNRRNQQAPTTGSLVRNCVGWLVANTASEMVLAAYPDDRKAVVRYEDFVMSSSGTLSALAKMVGKDPGSLGFVDHPEQSRSSRHMVGGNALRFQRGGITAHPDLAWHTELTLGRAFVATATTLPGLVRYGYALRSGKTNDDIVTGAVG
jgi:hypothetical protein